MRPVEKVRAALGEGKPSGRGQSRHRCPAHDDHDPSLDVKEGDDGRVLLCCRAGCATEQIVATVPGITMADLAPPGPRAGSWEPIAEYPYRDEGGRLVYTVRRFATPEGKTFRPYLPGAEKPGLNGTRRVLYRLPEVLAAAATGGTVYVVEGEKDADAIAATGAVATCNLGGAGKWDRGYADQFRGAHVVVVADRDEPGYNHARTVAESLGGVARSVRTVVGKVSTAKADASDHLAAGHTLDELVDVDLTAPVERTAPAAQEQEPSSWAPIDLAAVALGGIERPIPTLLRRSDGRALLYAGRVHWFYGVSESAKTWIALVAVVEVVRAGGIALFVDFEGSPEEVFGRLRALGLTDDEIIRHVRYVQPDEPVVDGTDQASADLRAVLDETPQLVAVDAAADLWGVHHLKSGDNDDAVPIGAFLRGIARTTGATVVVIDHTPHAPREGGSTAPIGAVRKKNMTDGAMYEVIPKHALAPGTVGVSRLVIEKDRPGGVREHSPAKHRDGVRYVAADLTLDAETEPGYVIPTLDPVAPRTPGERTDALRNRMTKVLDTLLAHAGTDGLSGRQVEELVGGNRDLTRDALRALIDDKVVTVDSGPRNALLHKPAQGI